MRLKLAREHHENMVSIMQQYFFWAVVVLVHLPHLVDASRGGSGFLKHFAASEESMTDVTAFGGPGNMTIITAGEGNMTFMTATKGKMTSSQAFQAIANSSASQRPPKTTTPKPLFPSKDPNLGSVDSDDTKMTIQVIKVGYETAMEKFKKANARIAKMSCVELNDEREEMDKAWEELRDRAMLMRFEAARANALKALDIKSERTKHVTFKDTLRKSKLVSDTRDENVIAKKAVEEYEKSTVSHLNVLEQYALKCGVKDKWCEIGDSALNDKFHKMVRIESEVDTKFTEAGWLRNEAVTPMATTITKNAAELRWGEAMRTVGQVWTEKTSLATGLEVVTAACGLRPPAGLWAQPRKKCDQLATDPRMKALYRDNPQEFVRQWKELIGKKAGVTSDKVVVRVDCD